jgi:hypothetical protein
MIALEQQVQALWKERASNKPIAMNEMAEFARLEKSFKETVVGDDFVLLY